jgi:hypothetical protein
MGVARRKATEMKVINGTLTFWSSDNFWMPPYRSWPHPPNELEVLAQRAGVSDEELRASLHEQIQRRRRERGDAWKQLDETLDKRVAAAGDNTETTPGPHQQRI